LRWVRGSAGHGWRETSKPVSQGLKLLAAQMRQGTPALETQLNGRSTIGPAMQRGCPAGARARVVFAALVSIVLLATVAACGSSSEHSASASSPNEPPSESTNFSQTETAAGALSNPAQPAERNTTTPCDKVEVGHACTAATTEPSNPNQFPQRNCTTSIVVNRVTTCPFAENIFYEYDKSAQNAGGQSVEVLSPVTHKEYEVFCSTSGRLIGCTGSPSSTGIYSSFPTAAISAYTASDAAAYASSHTIGHPVQPAARSGSGVGPPTGEEQAKESSGGSEGEDEVGSYSHAGDQTFCEEHECIGRFEQEPGYVVECSDGTFSHSGGISGACSDHGGEK
jgi:hypothetical protein